MADREVLEQISTLISECNAPKNVTYWNDTQEAGDIKAKLTDLMSDEQKALFEKWEDLKVAIRKQEEIRAFCITFLITFNILRGARE